MRNTTGYIPRNMGDGSVWGGKYKTRNVIEMFIGLAVVYFFSKFIGLFVPYFVGMGIRFFLWLIVILLTLRGINGEPFSVFVLTFINYSNTRTYVTLQPPQREVEENEKRGFLERAADKLFTPGPKKKGGKTK